MKRRPFDEDLLETLDVLEEAFADTAEETLEETGRPAVEVLSKEGRSRTLRYRPEESVSSLRREQGWAVRAGDDRRSFHYAASGRPDPEAPWPEGDGRGLRLPKPRPVPEWIPPSQLDSPLVGESEALALMEALSRELDGEMPGARLVQAILDDGSSEEQIVSSLGVRARIRRRTASLRVEARSRRRGTPAVFLELAERDARRFSPPAVARRLADRLLVAERGESPGRDRGEFLLAPEVMTEIVHVLEPLWLGPRAPRRAEPLVGRDGRLASRALTVVDDGRLDGGVLEAPVDGEGVPTRQTVLVEEGIYRQPLLAWHQGAQLEAGAGVRRSGARTAGCSRRAGWRDLPVPGPTHLYVVPDPETSVGSLLGDLTRGYYLLATEGAARVDLEASRFAVPVAGFAIEGGRATGSVSSSWLVGGLSSLLQGIVAVARDLTFSPRGAGLIGTPSTLVKGLELRRRP